MSHPCIREKGTAQENQEPWFSEGAFAFFIANTAGWFTTKLARQEHPSQPSQEDQAQKPAKKGPSKGVTAFEVIAGTLLALGIALLRLRQRKSMDD